ncbi:MAG: hypothetical protein GY820_10260 [Gammaproteobacteria bacterium]|nr:hypothetical protein [Gammaproteobacteria bacterium]
MSNRGDWFRFHGSLTIVVSSEGRKSAEIQIIGQVRVLRLHFDRFLLGLCFTLIVLIWRCACLRKIIGYQNRRLFDLSKMAEEVAEPRRLALELANDKLLHRVSGLLAEPLLSTGCS